MTKQIFASRELYALAREQCGEKPRIDRVSEKEQIIGNTSVLLVRNHLVSVTGRGY